MKGMEDMDMEVYRKDMEDVDMEDIDMEVYMA